MYIVHERSERGEHLINWSTSAAEDTVGKVRPLVTRVGGVMARLGDRGPSSVIIRMQPPSVCTEQNSTNNQKTNIPKVWPSRSSFDILCTFSLSLPPNFHPRKFHPKNFGPKNFHQKFQPKIFHPKKFSPKKIFTPKIFTIKISPKNFSPKKLSPKKFSPKKFSPKKFSPKKFSPKKISPKKILPKQFSPKKDAKRRTETLTVCYIFGILIQCSTTQYRQVPLSRYSRALLSTTK